MQGRLRRGAIATAVAGAGFAAFASAAIADRYFHTAHLALTAIGSEPLKSGFVNDVHTNGSVNTAQERYQLNGAQPDTAYNVKLDIYSDSGCTSFLRSRPTATFTTNGSGNGQGDWTFLQTGQWPPPQPPTLTTVYIQWVISDATVPEYETACTPVVLGG